MPDNKTLNWLFRLLLWPFVLWILVDEEDPLDYEAFSNAPWFVAGVVCFLATPLAYLYRNTSLMEGVSIWGVFLVSFLLYIFIGLWCFFSDKVTNAPIPWQNNGRW
jgi:hypothetical protein